MNGKRVLGAGKCLTRNNADKSITSVTVGRSGKKKLVHS